MSIEGEVFLQNLIVNNKDQVLAGTFVCPKEVDDMTKCLLLALQQTLTISCLQSRKLDDITEGWRKAREATSSSPSLIHFGHYMAGTFNPTIAVFNARLANLGFTTSYSLKCWWTGLNVMLEKQKGNLNMEKLQIILLLQRGLQQQ